MKFIDLTGKVFGRLTVISQNPVRKNKQICWNCICECGAEKVIHGHSLKNGLSKSCGCGISESNVSRCTTHGMTGTTEFSIWKNMLSRCHSQGNPAFDRYGGRGIEVCIEWRESFENFYRDMGPRPSSLYSLDRVNNSSGYEKSNCRWATRFEQAMNTSRSKIWIVEGIEYETCTDAAKAFGVCVPTIIRWCNGHDGKPPKDNCSATLRYQE